MSIKTRSAIECPIFRAPKDLVCSVLPTFSDVIKYFLWVRHNLEQDRVNRNLLVSEATEIVAQKIEEIWKSASVPTVSHQRIVALIKEYQKKRKDLLKPYQQRKDFPSYKSKIEAFVKDSQRLFDIAACKCVEFEMCSCLKPNKVPMKERPFLQDQRSGRKMMIGSVDFDAVRQQQKRENKGKKDNIPEEPKPSTSFDNNDILLLESEPDSESEPELYDNDKEDPPPKLLLFSDEPSTSNLSNRNTSNLCVLAKTLDRYAVSDRAGAAIASAVLQDYGIINSEDSQHIIDRHKVRRARQKKRQELQKSSKIFLLRGLYFDGRKDKTLTFTDNRKRTIVEEHISLLQEPGSNYIGHLSPVSGTALSILDSLTVFLDNTSISLDSLEVVGCDGTNTNVGTKGGIISLLERKIKRPLQWFICQLHIGKLLTNCEKLPIVDFSEIACELPNIDTNCELSTDQKYLHEMCLAIKNGCCSEALSKRDPGRLVHSRWLTTANRLLRLYVSTANPTQNLITLVTFIIKVYGPMWFLIKTMPSCIHGVKHVFKTIVLCNYLSDDLKNVVHKVINRNGFFGHPENIILSMLWDDRRCIRQLAYCRILKARAKTDPSQLRVRNFVVPIFNFQAKEYYELVDCQNVNWTEPPITVPLTEIQLQEIVDDPEHSSISYIKDYPCHTQAVERVVKMVTEASTAVCGYEKRDGAIKSKLESRSIMPNFETKKDFPLK